MKRKEEILLDSVAKAPVHSGIIQILRDEEVQGKNKRYQALYDKIAWWYDLLERLSTWRYGKRTKESPWKPYISNFALQSNDNVLEVAIGTGANIDLLPDNVNIYGVDISLKMLKRCHAKMVRMKRPVVLTHAMAEELPFKDASFDVVYHIGGINFFTDKQKAINEMIRVAKPGARFLISDETEKLAKESEKMFIAKWFFKDRDEEIVPPVDLIPSTMQDIKLDYICDNASYVITFSKPT
jgi:ubiquinone/menaquinone biosynthesis C-methylase UbiE